MEQEKLDGIDALNVINKAIDDGLEPSNVSAVPTELQGDEQAKAYLKSFNYSLGRDSQGKVSKVTIN